MIKLQRKTNENCSSSFRLTSEWVPKVYLASYQLRIETIFKACSTYLNEQLTEQNCLSM